MIYSERRDFGQLNAARDARSKVRSSRPCSRGVVWMIRASVEVLIKKERYAAVVSVSGFLGLMSGALGRLAVEIYAAGEPVTRCCARRFGLVALRGEAVQILEHPGSELTGALVKQSDPVLRPTVVHEAALELRGTPAQQVVGRRRRMVVQVVGQEEELLVEPGLRHERVGVEDEPALRVDVDNAQAQPLVEYDPQTNIGALVRNQLLEASLIAGRARLRQGSRPPLLIEEPFVRKPRRHELAAKRDHVGHDLIGGLIGASQPPYVLAVHPGNQADAAVGRSFVPEPEFSVRQL